MYMFIFLLMQSLIGSSNESTVFTLQAEVLQSFSVLKPRPLQGHAHISTSNPQPVHTTKAFFFSQ